MSNMTGGEIIGRMLKEEGVEKVFGIIDGTYFGLYSSFPQYGIDLITPRHEAIAAHMAGAYARLTGKLGVCMASNGPGVANVLAGVAVENGEGNRVLLITSSRRKGISSPDRGGAYQYFNQVGVIKPMSKWSGSVSAFERIPEMLRRAFRLSYRGRPGVVHLDVPEDLMNGKCKAPPFWAPHQYRNVNPIRPASDLVEKAARMLVEADFPVIHAGSGIIHAGAFEELEQVAEMLHAPVTTSWSGRGVFRETSGLSWPMIHVKAVNEVRNNSDLILCLGSRLGETDWWGKAPYWRQPDDQKLIQVDIDEEVLGVNRPAELAILADVRLFLAGLLEKIEELKSTIPITSRKQKLAMLAKERDKDRAKLDTKLEDRSSPMLTGHVASICRQFFDDDAVVIFDGGNTAVWGNFYHEARTPNTLLSTHHFGMLGAGIGQALGASVARPNSPVYCIIGDGAFGFHPQEIETAVRNNLRPIFLVCSDKQWGMVKINQQFALKPVKTMIKKSLGPEETINTDLGEIEFDKLARSMGGHGERVSDPEELVPAIERSLNSGKCSVIHVDVDPVKHMWAPGLLHFKDMHKEPAGR
ncbi:MAG: thiamine pyrophosphate-binding protein [Thermodesulfobacteriota bacterium]|nr:thiamine pyrophosphate-binding protein [Thermodesulfobacteriota bacterium]